MDTALGETKFSFFSFPLLKMTLETEIVENLQIISKNDFFSPYFPRQMLMKMQNDGVLNSEKLFI